MNLKLMLAVLSLVPAVIAYTVYFRSLFAGKTKPHAFSWLIWGTLSGIGCVAQVQAGAGPGAWATGVTSVVSLSIFLVALTKEDKHITRFDWVLLSLAMIALLLLFVVNSPTIALSITLIALWIGFSMTLRKAYYYPHEENATAFLLNTIKFLPAIFAVNTFSFLTVAYPIAALLGNAAIAAMVYVCRNRRQVEAYSTDT